MMMWIIEPAAPWRVAAADKETGEPRTSSFLDYIDPNDRTIVATALTDAMANGHSACGCHRVRTPPAGDAAAAGHLALRRVTGTNHANQIVAIWRSESEHASAGPRPDSATSAGSGTNGDRCVVDDQTMRQFLKQVSHELRTPLNGVLGMTRLMLDSGLRADQVDYARAIDTSAEHLLSVIEDLLEFATLDVKTALHPVDFAPRALMDDVVESLAWRAAENEVEVCALVSAKVPELAEGDAARLRQVLCYLVSDGISSTSIGDVIVRLTLEDSRDRGERGERGAREDEDTDEVTLKFEVAAGAAEPADAAATAATATAKSHSHEHAFDVSPRAAVCRHLVTLMNGTLGSATDKSGGRASWFTARVKPKPVPPATVAGYVSLAGRRVLCVDDHPVSQRVLLERLRGWNLQADAIDEAHGALTLMKVASSAGTPFDLVILDLRLPGMDGLALARLIKADPALASTKLILLTGYPARGQATMAQEAGIDAYLQKPIREAPLRACLETLLSGGGAGGAAQAHGFMPLITGRRLTEGRMGLRPRVLVAEDNPTNQKVAVQMLEKLGCRVDVVTDGADAVDAVERTAYHLVLMDCQMGAMNGVDAARRIRSLPDHVSSPPIVAISGEMSDQERMNCLDAGMNDFLVKPLRLVTLREKLAQWIESAPHPHPHVQR